MTPHLAIQSTVTILAEIATVIIASLGLYLGGSLLMRRKANLAAQTDEITREQEARSKPMKVDVQQPLEIIPATSFVTQGTFEREIAIIRERTNEIDAQLEKLRVTVEARDGLFNKSINEIRADINNLPDRIIKILSATKQLHAP